MPAATACFSYDAALARMANVDKIRDALHKFDRLVEELSQEGEIMGEDYYYKLLANVAKYEGLTLQDLAEANYDRLNPHG